jgi:hypothetical protein
VHHDDLRRRARVPVRASAALAELDELEAGAPNPTIARRPLRRDPDEVLYHGRRVVLVASDREAPGSRAVEAREHNRRHRQRRSEVVVITPDGIGALEHFPFHSRDGFAWGRDNSAAAADLARAILLHHHGVRPRSSGDLYPPHAGELPVSYIDFKLTVIARLPRERPWTLSRTAIRNWERRAR